MFQQLVQGSCEDVVQIEVDFRDWKAFSALLMWVHGGTHMGHYPASEVEQVLRLAEQYNIPQLHKECVCMLESVGKAGSLE